MPLYLPAEARAESFQAAPEDHGFLAWSTDLALGSTTQSVLPANGILGGARLYLSNTAMISNIVIYVITAGATLTANQCGAAIYENGATPALSPLKGQTANTQNTSWQSVGLKVMPLLTPFLATPGYYDVAAWRNGTTAPAISRGTGSSSANANLTGTAIRCFTANTLVTTAAPTTLGTKTGTSNGWFFALT